MDGYAVRSADAPAPSRSWGDRQPVVLRRWSSGRERRSRSRRAPSSRTARTPSFRSSASRSTEIASRFRRPSRRGTISASPEETRGSGRRSSPRGRRDAGPHRCSRVVRDRHRARAPAAPRLDRRHGNRAPAAGRGARPRADLRIERGHARICPEATGAVVTRLAATEDTEERTGIARTGSRLRRRRDVGWRFGRPHDLVRRVQAAPRRRGGVLGSRCVPGSPSRSDVGTARSSSVYPETRCPHSSGPCSSSARHCSRSPVIPDPAPLPPRRPGGRGAAATGSRRFRPCPGDLER